MMIDEQASIRSIIEALKTNNIDTVAKQIDGISKDPLGKALNKAGYKYSNSKPKGWHYVAGGVEPLEKSIFDFVKRSSSPVNSSSPKIHKNITESNREVTVTSPSLHNQFTDDEISMIKEILKSWKESSPTIQLSDSLHDRIKQLSQGSKTRKTIVIDSTIGKRFDGFCDAEKVNKSDVLHLALLDFMDRYEGVKK